MPAGNPASRIEARSGRFQAQFPSFEVFNLVFNRVTMSLGKECSIANAGKPGTTMSSAVHASSAESAAVIGMILPRRALEKSPLLWLHAANQNLLQ